MKKLLSKVTSMAVWPSAMEVFWDFVSCGQCDQQPHGASQEPSLHDMREGHTRPRAAPEGLLMLPALGARRQRPVALAADAVGASDRVGGAMVLPRAWLCPRAVGCKASRLRAKRSASCPAPQRQPAWYLSDGGPLVCPGSVWRGRAGPPLRRCVLEGVGVHRGIRGTSLSHVPLTGHSSRRGAHADWAVSGCPGAARPREMAPFIDLPAARYEERRM